MTYNELMPEKEETIDFSDIISIKFSREKTKKILWNFIFGGIIFILALPILGDYGNMLFPLGRDIIFRISVEIIFYLYLILIALDKKYLPRISLISFFLFLFLAASGFSTIFSTQPQFSFWGNIFRGQGFFSQIHYFLFFLIITGIIKNKNHWKIIIKTVIFVSFVVAIIGLIESGAHGKIQSTLNNPIFYGTYLLLVIFINLALALKEKRRGWKIIFWMIFVVLTLNLYFTYSFGSYLGFIAGIFAFTVYFLIFKIESKKILLGLSIFTIFTIIFGIIGFRVFPVKITEPGTWKKFIEYKIAGRIEPWQAAWNGMKEKPIFGFGPENFIVVSDKYFSGKLDENYAWWDKAHNFIMEIGATTGLTGLLSYFGILAAVFIYLFRTKQKFQTPASEREKPDVIYIKIGLAATFSAYIIQGSFSIDTTISFIYLTLWFGFVNFINDKKDADPKESDIHKKNYGKIALLTILIAFFPFLIFITQKLNIKTLTANLAINRAESFLEKGQFNKGFLEYEKVLKIDSSAVNPYARFRYGEAAISLATQRKYYDQTQDLQNIKRALELQEQNAKNEWPYFTRNWIYAGILTNFLIENGTESHKKADQYFKKAVELSPRRADIWLEWSKTYIASKNYAEAKNKVEKAISINKNFGKTWWFLGLVNLYESNTYEAQKNFKKAADLGYDVSSLDSLNKLKEVYLNKNDWENSIKVLQQLIEKYPEVLEYKIILAKVYKDSGDKIMARQSLEHIFNETPPFFQKEIKKILDESR